MSRRLIEIIPVLIYEVLRELLLISRSMADLKDRAICP